MNIFRTIAALTGLAALAACGGTATKGDLRNSDRVVTNETDEAALAAVRAVSNTWASAQAADRASRAGEDARVEGAASNLFSLAQAARYAGDTNLAFNLETARTNLLQHFTALADAERYSRQTNVWAWGDALMSESRSTNAVTRGIAAAALAAVSNATVMQVLWGYPDPAYTELGFALNYINQRAYNAQQNLNSHVAGSSAPVTAVYNPDNPDEWIDGSGSKWRSGLSTNWVVTFPGGLYFYRGDDAFSPSQESYTMPQTPAGTGNFDVYAADGDWLFNICQRANYTGFYASYKDDDGTWEKIADNLRESQIEGPVVANVTSYGMSYDGWPVFTRQIGIVTSRVDTVVMRSDISAYPTNYVAGFALPVPGTNALYTLSVGSNGVLSVWSVTP